MNNTTSHPQHSANRVVLGTVVALLSLVFYLSERPTAYEWPAIDMGPYLERRANPDFVPSDFLTNASQEANPRQVFGELVHNIAQNVSASWYSVFFAIKLLMVLLVPMAMYTVISRGVRYWCARPLGQTVEVLLATSCVLALSTQVSFSVAVGWWQPYAIQASSQSVTILLALISAMVWPGGRWEKLLGTTVFFLATLLHPVCAFYTYLFARLLRPRCTLRNEVIFFALGWILPTLCLRWMFHSEASLSREEFASIYAELYHPQHYWPSAFQALGTQPWWTPAAAILAILCGVAWYAHRHHLARLRSAASVSAAAYASSVLLQYLFVEVFPIKLVAVFGPARFSMFGYWLAIAGIAAVIRHQIAPRPSLARVDRYVELVIGLSCLAVGIVFLVGTSVDPVVLGRYSLKRAACGFGFLTVAGVLIDLQWMRVRVPRWTRWLPYSGFAVLGIAYVITFQGVRDNPLEDHRKANEPLFAWLEDHTSEDSIFAVYPSTLVPDFPLVAKRALLVGNGFVFSESQMRELASRTEAIYGSVKLREAYPVFGKFEQSQAYFASRSLADFKALQAKYRVDYVVIPRDVPSPMHREVPEYSDDTWVVYRVD